MWRRFLSVSPAVPVPWPRVKTEPAWGTNNNFLETKEGSFLCCIRRYAARFQTPTNDMQVTAMIWAARLYVYLDQLVSDNAIVSRLEHKDRLGFLFALYVDDFFRFLGLTDVLNLKSRGGVGAMPAPRLAGHQGAPMRATMGQLHKDPATFQARDDFRVCWIV